MKIFGLLFFASEALNPVQLQGLTDQGTPFTAEKGPAGLAYQEGGESLVASPGTRTDFAVGFQTYCIEGNECYTAMTQFTDYKFDGVSLSASGKDKQGTFKMVGTVNSQGGTSITKQYLNAQGVHNDQQLEVSIEAEEAPNDEGLIFGRFTFTANRPGFSGTGRSAAAFVEQTQTSFDSRFAAQN